MMYMRKNNTQDVLFCFVFSTKSDVSTFGNVPSLLAVMGSDQRKSAASTRGSEETSHGKFARVHKLSQDRNAGRPDAATFSGARKPRCGVPDLGGMSQMRPDNGRQKRYSVDWTRWSKKHLTYRWVYGLLICYQ